MRRVRLRRTLVVIGALTLGLTVPATSGAQAADPIDLGDALMEATVTQVLVNSAGGIKVSGTLNCPDAKTDFVAAVLKTSEVEAWKSLYPLGTVEVTFTGLYSGGEVWVPVSPDFTATQYLGRTRVITAEYRSGIARWCYMDGGTGPYPWWTVYPVPLAPEQWILSSTGKFSAGSIHVEMNAVGDIEATAYGTISGQVFPIATFKQKVYGFSGWDLRAQKVRR